MSDTLDKAAVAKDFGEAVNMGPAAIEKWLGTKESKSVGDTHARGGTGGESTGHKSGQRIVKILGKAKSDLTDSDYRHMRKVSGYVHRHLKQRPSGDVTETRWRYSLMNWGHDPKK